MLLGTYHTCGIRNDGELFCFGFNNVGQLGDGTNGANTDKNTPTRAGVNSDWTHISSGGTYTCGIRNNNDLFCFGNNLSGQLGDGTNNNKNTPSSIPFCGNSVIDTGEECDDGLTPNQDCVHNETSCTVCNVSCEEVSGISHVCGDGFVDTEEECDDANSNSDTDADACRIDCSSPSCGDGVKDTGEDCDDGLTPSQDCAYNETSCKVCNESCVEVSGATYICGDSIKNREEECDNGSSNSNTEVDACRIDCSSPSCGDGVKDTEEACDDGLTPNKDCAYNEMSCTVCNVSCEEIQGIVRVGGDGIIDAEEVCDGGVNNSDTDANVCRTRYFNTTLITNLTTRFIICTILTRSKPIITIFSCIFYTITATWRTTIYTTGICVCIRITIRIITFFLCIDETIATNMGDT